MKSKKLFLFLAGLLSIIQAWGYDFEVNGIYYRIINENTRQVGVTYKDNSYNSYEGAVTVPEKVIHNEKEYSVTEILSSAFYRCEKLTSVTLPEGMTTIGSQGFSSSPSLLTIRFPSTLSRIARGALSNTAWYNAQPDGLLYVGSVLYECKGEFSGSSHLEIREGTLGISERALRGVPITSVTIPESMVYISAYSFQECNELSTLYFNAIDSQFDGWDGGVFGGASLTNVVIGEKVKTIPGWFFVGCTSLKSITLPASVTKIEESAFYYTGITDVYVKSYTPAICVERCFYMTNAVLHVPVGSITKYRNTAVWREFSVITEDCERDGIRYESISETEVKVMAGSDKYEGEITLPATINDEDRVFEVVEIGASAFRDCENLTSINFPEHLRTINTYAFAGCTGLTSVTFPGKLTRIDASAFLDCDGLTSIEFPESLTYIGTSAFSGCTQFTSLTIPVGVTGIGSNAFYGSTRIRTISLPQKALNKAMFGSIFYQNRDNVSISGYKYQGTDNSNYRNYVPGYLTEVHISDTSKIADNSFINCSEIISFSMPYVTEIGTNSFKGCTYLATLEWGNLLTTIEASAFMNCRKLTNLDFPESLQEIGESAFSGCSLAMSHLYLPHAKVHKEAFAGYQPDSLTLGEPSVSISNIFNAIPTTLTYIHISDRTLTELPAGVFENCTHLKHLTVPFVGVSSMATGQKSLLGSVFGTTPDPDMKAITQYDQTGSSTTYYLPVTLEKLTITRPCNELAYGALYGCSSLKVLDIASSINGIGENALYGCSGLEHIYARGAAPAGCYENTFTGVRNVTCVLHVPAGSKKYYELAEGWNKFYWIEEEAALSITTAAVPLYGGIITGYGEYNYEDDALLEAIAHSGYEFKCWMEGEKVVSTSPVYTFIATQNRTLYAVFVGKENEDKNVQVTPRPTTAVIEWTSVEGASTYTLVVYGDEARTLEIVRFNLDRDGNVVDNRAATSTFSCTVSGLNPDTDYFYTLTSYNDEKIALTMSQGNFTTTDATGIEESHEEMIYIYPNPSQEGFYIHGLQEQAEITIIDLNGKIVFRQKIVPQEYIPVNAIYPGIYLIRIQTKDNVLTQKFTRE